MATTSHQSIARPYSRYSREAVVVLGQHIRINRIEQKLSVQELAERVGIGPVLRVRCMTVLGAWAGGEAVQKTVIIYSSFTTEIPWHKRWPPSVTPQ